MKTAGDDYVVHQDDYWMNTDAGKYNYNFFFITFFHFVL